MASRNGQDSDHDVSASTHRIRRPLLSNKFDLANNSGKHVDVYIIDSGVTSLSAFDDRLILAGDPTNNHCKDIWGHGTSIASVIGSKSYGLAHQATLHIYKVDPISGKADGVSIKSAIEDVVAKNKRRRSCDDYRGAVLNLSFTLDDSCLTAPIQAALQAGISVVIAAGNNNQEVVKDHTQHLDPDSLKHAICVGAYQEGYCRARFSCSIKASNYGRDVTLFAPGKRVRGYDRRGKKTRQLQGTSMACAYVSGVLAMYIGAEDRILTPEAAKDMLIERAKIGWLGVVPRNTENLVVDDGWLDERDGPSYWDRMRRRERRMRRIRKRRIKKKRKKRKKRCRRGGKR